MTIKLLPKIKQEVIEAIKNKEFFWLYDLKEELGYTDSDSISCKYIGDICRKLCLDGVLIATERKGNHIQYMVA
jgi:hypothetical protein